MLCVNVAEKKERAGQNTRQISEGETATEQDSPCTSSQALQRERTSESVSAGATQTQVSPGASAQSTHEWTQESVQERETTSESATAGHTTQTPERPEDTTQSVESVDSEEDCNGLACDGQ